MDGAVRGGRAPGGLDDTVEEWNPELGTGTGFKFHGFSDGELMAAITRAITAFQFKPGWKKLMLNGMAQNYSWDQPARQYAAIYDEVARRQG
jgi:starch synthase